MSTAGIQRRAQRAAGAGGAVACHAAGRCSADRAPVGVAGLGRTGARRGSWRTIATPNSVGRPAAAPLATLDKAGRVIYCGTFSKTLAPALRLGFAVVPAPLIAAFVRLRTLTDRGTDTFTQATLAEFMRQGLLSPHIRRMRTEYSRRRDALLEAMARHAASIRRWRRPVGCTWWGGWRTGWTRQRRCGRVGRGGWRCRRSGLLRWPAADDGADHGVRRHACGAGGGYRAAVGSRIARGTREVTHSVRSKNDNNDKETS